jgi:hypothetical protein
MGGVSRDVVGKNARCNIRITVGQDDVYQHPLFGDRLGAGELDLLVVVDGELVLLMPWRRACFIPSVMRSGEMFGSKKETGRGLGLTIPLDNENVTVATPLGRELRRASFAAPSSSMF